MITVWPSGVYSWWTTPLWWKKTVNITSTSPWTWHAFFGLGIIHCDDWAFVSGSYPQTQDSSLVIIVFMKLASWSTHCSRSLATAMRVSFCLTVSSFGKTLAETHFMPKSSVRSDYRTKWKPQLVRGLSNFYDLPERSPLSTDVCPSLNCINHSLTCVQPIAFFPKAFWIISYHRFLGSSAKVCGKTWCRCASKLSQSSSMQQAQHTQQQVLANFQELAIQAGSSNSCTC